MRIDSIATAGRGAGGSFVIDSLPERAALYRRTHAIVVVDVFRATTSIVTALANGHPVYPVATVADARRVAASLHDPLLAGEQAGIKPSGFHLNNSPFVIAALGRDQRPLVIVSSAGTLLLANAFGASQVLVACLRNHSATAHHLAAAGGRVALIGAGTKGESRDEDQYACALIGRHLLEAGFQAETPGSLLEIERWAGVPVTYLGTGRSAAYLTASGQEYDIGYVLETVDDVSQPAFFDGTTVRLAGGPRAAEMAPAELASVAG